MSKKSMAARRQMQETRYAGRGAQRGQAQSRSRGKRRDQRSRPWGLIAGAFGVVAAFIVVVLLLESGLSSSIKQDTTVLPASASLLKAVTTIPASTLEEVKGGSINNPAVNIPASYKAATLTSNGLPEIAFVGAEYCPYCALERWSLIVGLSRFGTWSNLHLIRSSAYETDNDASIATFSFAHGASYTSPYLVFVGREYQSNITHDQGANWGSLQSLPTIVSSAFSSIDPNLGYPFLDYGGKMAQVGSEANSVSALEGLDWNQIAAQLRQPKSAVAKLVLGGANYVTASACILTGDKPAKVCGSSMIQSLEKQVKASE